MRIRNLIFIAMLAVVVCITGNIARAETKFEKDVSAAIDDGLTYLRNVNAFTDDSYSGHDGQRRARGLALLALLEKRTNFGDPVNGYSGSSVADKALAEATVIKILEDNLFGAQRRFQAYQHGSNLMALTFYAKTGGPEVTNSHIAKTEWHWINGAWVLVTTPAGSFTLRQAIDKMVTEAIDAQGKSVYSPDDVLSPDDNGFWIYEYQGDDSSTTQFVVAGLAAAKGYYIDQGDTAALDRRDDITAVLARTAAGYYEQQNSDGGEGYDVSSSRSSYQQTASALWCLLLGGSDLNHSAVQAKLNWQYQRYNYQTIYAAFESWHQPYYYHLWSSAKAYTLIEESGVLPDEVPPGSGIYNLTTTDIGTLPTAPITVASHGVDRSDYRLAHRNPLADVRPTPRKDGITTGENDPGFYSVENQRWYYDFAYSLMTQQNTNTASSDFGQFTNTQYINNGATLWTSAGWNRYAEHAYAILILERALGGACLDTDGDGICNDDDLCPNNKNPQVDSDEDGIGDDCDTCPNDADNDADSDGICGDVDSCPNDAENDADGDGICGDIDPCPYDANNDADADGVCGDVDNCPTVANPGQEDADGDGVGDVCDNCVNDANSGQVDSDNDGWGDACDKCPQEHDGADSDPLKPGCPANKPPVAICQDVIVSAGAGCKANASIDNGSTDPDIIPKGDVITLSQVPAGPYSLGTTTVILTVKDLKGLTSSCEATVKVVDDTPPTIDCPANITVDNVLGECGSIVTFDPIIVNDNCSVASTVSTPASGSFFNVGTTTVSYLVTDGSGNTNTCSFTVTVNDAEDPMISCPDNIDKFNDKGVCGAKVNYTAPVGTDNCPGVTTAPALTNLGSGVVFPVGTTTESFTVTDAAGNTKTCSFEVTVEDNEAPVVTALLVPIKVKKKHGCFQVDLSAVDNCDGVIDPLTITAVLNDHAVSHGDLVRLHNKLGKRGCRVKVDDGSSDDSKSHDDGSSADCGTVKFECNTFTLEAEVADSKGNVGDDTNDAQPVFGYDGGSHDHDSKSDDDSTSGHSHDHNSDDEGSSGKKRGKKGKKGKK
ncbi:MAG: HYR domain-containing protein [Candidatus Scalindua sp.]|jgi:hypothetical protein|nr:HYR domain-containing protein [Candidatus Scalindua sp.]